jgi:hypothetical protein
MKINVRSLVWLAVGAVLCSAWPASAQVSRVGNSKGVLTTPNGLVRGHDVSYDPANDAYLVTGAGGFVRGVFTNNVGDIVPGTGVFAVGSSNGTDPAYGSYPRSAYGADVNGGQGGFLVTWHQYNGAVNVVRGSIVTYPGTVSTDVAISTGGTSWQEAGASVAYSPTSKRFLVAWQTIPTYQIQARFVGIDGQPIGSVFTIETTGARDPSLTWNPSTDEFGLVATAFNNTGGFVGFRRIAAGTGAISARTTWGFTTSTFITAITVNPSTNNYIAAWSPGAAARYAELDAAGTVLAEGNVGVGSYDGLDIDYNVASGSILAVGNGNSNDVLGLELNGAGVPIGALQVLTNGGGTSGSFYPRTTPATTTKRWGISYSRQFTAGAIQIVETATSLGGPVSNIQMSIDSPASGAVLQNGFSVSGYAVDRAATSGSGIDAIHVYAVRTGGTPQFVGQATSFSGRNDVGSAFGAQFTNAGYSVPVTGLTDGTYQILVYPHSTVTGAFGTPRSVTISISSSLPLMAMDSPATNSTIAANFTVSGWAIDRFASNGTGIENVHVWAFRSTGEATFLGAATTGLSRTDVGGFFGAQFNSSGWSLSASLNPGNYQVIAYVQVARTGTFDLAQTANVTIAAGVSSPITYIDSPMTGNVSMGSSVTGWAVDLGSSNGPGADVVHVYAAPVAGGPWIFVGASGVSGSRPDVASGLGNSRYTNSGYSVTLVGLEHGVTYDLIVYARSTVSGVYNAQVVRVTTN